LGADEIKRLMMGRLISATGFCLPTGRLPMTRQNEFGDTLTLALSFTATQLAKA
jgi:hypothetical protein